MCIWTRQYASSFLLIVTLWTMLLAPVHAAEHDHEDAHESCDLCALIRVCEDVGCVTASLFQTHCPMSYGVHHFPAVVSGQTCASTLPPSRAPPAFL